MEVLTVEDKKPNSNYSLDEKGKNKPRPKKSKSSSENKDGEKNNTNRVDK